MSIKRSDLELTVQLVQTGQHKAAERLLELAVAVDKTAEDLRAVEFEFVWLVRHARELPVEVYEDDAQGVSVTPMPDSGSYVLRECPRLGDIMAGKLPDPDRSK